MNSQPTFAELRAVVTGSSSGIGRQIAVELARQSEFARVTRSRDQGSAKMILHFRRNESGARATAEHVRSHGVSVEVVQADLCDSRDRDHLIESSWRFLGRPTTWVNNAGADVLTGAAAEQSFSEKLRQLIETDVIATIELTRSVAERLRRSEHDAPPSITFIGWDQAPLGMEGDAGQIFGPAKAAVMAFANHLAQDVAPGIRVNTIAPGWIQTAWGESTNEYWNRRAMDQSLMGRWGTPADVAAAVCFAADPKNGFLTGQTIDVNGGWSRRYPSGSSGK